MLSIMVSKRQDWVCGVTLTLAAQWCGSGLDAPLDLQLRSFPRVDEV